MNRTVLVLLFAFACPAYGGGSVQRTKGATTQTNGAATLEIRYDTDEPQISLADLITVELRVDGGKDLYVEIPEGVPAGWTFVKPLLPLVKEPISKDRMRWRLVTRFAPDQPSKKVSFVYPVVSYRDGTDAHTVKFAPVDFVVTTQFSNPDVTQLRDNADIEPLPSVAPPPPTPWIWLAVGAAIVVFVVTALGMRRYWRRSARSSAARLALKEWRRLVALRLPEKGHSERFITLLTLLVRQYLERQFSVPARRRTTPEFLGQLAQMSTLTKDEKQFLSSFLVRAEHIKFANAPMSSDECARWADDTRRFLEPRVQN